MVSIIIPLYNRIIFFPETISSVFTQTYKNWEVIIVDDHSTDGSFEYSQQLSLADKRVKVIKNNEDKKGASAARNTGLLHASGKYIIFLDSDDLLSPGCLEQRVGVLEAKPELDFAIFKQETFTDSVSGNKRLFNSYPLNKRDSFLKMFLRNQNPWSITCPIWRKEILLNLKGFDEDLIYMEDPDLHARAIYGDYKFQVYEHLPVDSFYRIDNIDSTKKQVFYKNSILSRILFIKKMTLLITENGKQNKEDYLKDIRAAYKLLVKNFLLARISLFQSEFYSLTDFLKSQKILDRFVYFKFLITGKIFLSKSPLLRAFRIKGLIYKFL